MADINVTRNMLDTEESRLKHAKAVYSAITDLLDGKMMLLRIYPDANPNQISAVLQKLADLFDCANAMLEDPKDDEEKPSIGEDGWL